MNIKDHTYFDLIGWDYDEHKTQLERLKLDLIYYEDMVEMGDLAFRGANKARQRVSFRKAIKKIKRQIREQENYGQNRVDI